MISRKPKLELAGCVRYRCHSVARRSHIRAIRAAPSDFRDAAFTAVTYVRKMHPSPEIPSKTWNRRRQNSHCTGIFLYLRLFFRQVRGSTLLSAVSRRSRRKKDAAAAAAEATCIVAGHARYHSSFLHRNRLIVTNAAKQPTVHNPPPNAQPVSGTSTKRRRSVPSTGTTLFSRNQRYRQLHNKRLARPPAAT